MSSPVTHIHVVFKTHFDIGFTHLVKELRDWYGGDMLREAVELCEQTANRPSGQRYAWTLPAWPLRKALESCEDETLRQRAETLIQNGQLLWHALPFTTHTEFCGMEELIRGLSFAKELDAQYSKHTISAKMTDVPGHTWILPSLLTKYGVRFLHLGSNPCAAQPEVPPLFYWEGPDGARVLTFYAKGGYGSGLLPPKDWPYPCWLAMMAKSENTGVHSPEVIDDLLNRAASELPGCTVSVGSMDDFALAVLSDGYELPVIRGDLADTWIRGVGSAPAEVSLARTLRQTLKTAEAANALTLPGGLSDDLKSAHELQDAYEKLLLFGEHTWGLDTKCTILPERRYGQPWDGYPFWSGGSYVREVFQKLEAESAAYQRMEASWQEQGKFLRDADLMRRRAERALSVTLAPDAETITVFSASGQKTHGEIALPENFPGTHLRNSETGELFPIHLDGTKRRYASISLPAAGFVEYRAVEKPQTKPLSACTYFEKDAFVSLENGFVKLEMDKDTGCLSHLVDKRTGHDWVRPGGMFGQYCYDVYSGDDLDRYLTEYLRTYTDWGINDNGKAGYPKEQPHVSSVPRTFQMALEQHGSASTLIASASITDETATDYGNAHAVETRITIYDKKPYVDFCFTLKDKSKTPMLETGQFMFPVAVTQSICRLNKLGCVINPATDILSGCNRDLLCAEKWLDVSGAEGGLAFFPLDMPLCAFRPDAVMRHTNRFVEEASTVFCHAFNNGWGTNFPQWMGGDFTYRIRLWPHGPEVGEEAVHLAAEDCYNRPLMLPGTWDLPGFDLLPDGLDGFMILALKRAVSGDGMILRVRDIRGTRRTASIAFSSALSALWNCGLPEAKRDEISLLHHEGRAIASFASHPYEVHTFYLVFERKRKNGNV